MPKPIAGVSMLQKIARSLNILLLCMVLDSMPSFGAENGTESGAEILPPQGATGTEAISFENDVIKLRLRPRTTQQMAAFFEARGFPQAMRQRLAKYCFMTVVMKNKSTDVVWLELDNWRFQSAHGSVERIPRSHWPPLWQQMHIPLAAQSTFRWTLLPERLDFQPQEGEGGNILLVPIKATFALRARFAVGKDKRTAFNIHVSNLRCASDPEREERL